MNVINLWAGPGAGKSTLAAGLFHKMKSAGETVELVTEYAKELVYETSPRLSNSLVLLAEQDLRLRRLLGQVDYAITDCPLPMTTVYSRAPFDRDWFNACTWGTFNTYNNLNIYVDRVKPFYSYGRYQTESDARELDKKIKRVVDRMDVPYLTIAGDEQGPDKAYEYVKRVSL